MIITNLPIGLKTIPLPPMRCSCGEVYHLPTSSALGIFRYNDSQPLSPQQERGIEHSAHDEYIEYGPTTAARIEEYLFDMFQRFTQFQAVDAVHDTWDVWLSSRDLGSIKYSAITPRRANGREFRPTSAFITANSILRNDPASILRPSTRCFCCGAHPEAYYLVDRHIAESDPISIGRLRYPDREGYPVSWYANGPGLPEGKLVCDVCLKRHARQCSDCRVTSVFHGSGAEVEGSFYCGACYLIRQLQQSPNNPILDNCISKTTGTCHTDLGIMGHNASRVVSPGRYFQSDRPNTSIVRSMAGLQGSDTWVRVGTPQHFAITLQESLMRMPSPDDEPVREPNCHPRCEAVNQEPAHYCYGHDLNGCEEAGDFDENGDCYCGGEGHEVDLFTPEGEEWHSSGASSPRVVAREGARNPINTVFLCNLCLASSGHYSVCLRCHHAVLSIAPRAAGSPATCPNCLGNITIRNYSYKPEPIFHPEYPIHAQNSYDLFFMGMELEASMRQGIRPETALQQFGPELDPDLFYVKQDSSVYNGFEIVTHPFKPDWGLANFPFELFDRIVERWAYKTHHSSGTHIHLSKAAFTEEHLWKLLKFHIENAQIIRLIGERGYNFHPHLNGNELAAPTFSSEEVKTETLAKMAKDKTGNTARTTAINLQNAETIELRYMTSDLSSQGIQKNIEWMKALFLYTESLSPIQVVSGALDNFSHFWEWLQDKQSVYPALFAFIKKAVPMIKGVN